MRGGEIMTLSTCFSADFLYRVWNHDILLYSSKSSDETEQCG